MEEPADTFRSELQGRIAFVSGGSETEYGIWVMQADGSERRRVAAFRCQDIVCSLAWSPSAEQIVFTSHRDGDYEIYVMNADGSDQKRLTRTGGYGAAWSTDGKRIAFTSLQSGAEEVYVMNADGSDQRRLTATSYYVTDQYGSPVPKAFNRNPTWSPDGERIAFASDRSGTLEIYSMNADGSEPRRLTYSEESKDMPRWSPTGEHIVFSGVEGISVLDALGTNLRQLTTHGLHDSCATWSPDGKYIAYETLLVDRDQRTRKTKSWRTIISVMKVTTTHSMRLTPSNAHDSYPCWTR